jgi:hypothetical protein
VPQQAPDVQTVLQDDDFKQLQPVEKHKVLLSIDPDYKGLPPQEQAKALDVIQYGPRDAEPSKIRTAAREGMLGLLSGVSGLPETTTPMRSAVDSLEKPPSPWEMLDPTGGAITNAIGIGKRAYGAGKEVVEGIRHKDTGEIAHGTGSLVGQALPFVAGGARAPMGDAITEARSAGRVAAGTEDVFRASVGGAGRQINLRDNIEAARGDLAEIERKTPLKGRGGWLNPDMRLRNFANNANDYLKDMWSTEVQPQVDRWSKAQVDLKPTKKAMLDTITDTDRESNPTGVRQIQKWVDRMPDNDTIGGMAARRKTINALLRSFEEKSGSEQAAVMKTKPLVEALKAQDREIATSMFDELKRRGEPGMDAVEKRYAALSNIRDTAQAQMNTAERMRLLEKFTIYINPSRYLGGRERLTVEPSAGRLMQKGSQKLAKSGIAPDATKPRVGPAIPPPPSRMLPAIGETTTEQSDPALGRQAPGGPKTTLPPRPAPESESGTFPLARRVDLGKKAPGGPSTTPPPVRVGESGGAPSQFRSPRRSINLGVSSTKEAPGKLARVPGRQYRTPDVNVIKGGTATPDVRVGSREQASSLPQADTWSGMRTRLQGVIDDPMASSSDKVAARNHIKLLSRTTRTGPAEPQMEPHLAEQVRTGKITHGEIFRMERTGVIPKGSASRIFRLSRASTGLPPPPERSGQ